MQVPSFTSCCKLALAILVVITLLSLYTLGLDFLEAMAAFAPYTCALSIILIPICLAKKGVSRSLLWILIISTLLLSNHVFQGYSGPALKNGRSDLLVMQANLYHHNPDPQSAIEVLLEINPGLISIQELNAEWRTHIDQLMKPHFPYFIEEYEDDCCYGIGIYSKFPIVLSRKIEMEGVTTIEVHIEVNGRTVSVFSQHTLPPLFPNNTEERNNQLAALATLVRQQTLPVIVLGDLNIVPWDPIFRDFLDHAQLLRVGAGFQATYPMDLGVPLIPIDHITCSDKLLANSSSAFEIPGSDHRGLMAGFSFKD